MGDDRVRHSDARDVRAGLRTALPGEFTRVGGDEGDWRERSELDHVNDCRSEARRYKGMMRIRPLRQSAETFRKFWGVGTGENQDGA